MSEKPSTSQPVLKPQHRFSMDLIPHWKWENQVRETDVYVKASLAGLHFDTLG